MAEAVAERAGVGALGGAGQGARSRRPAPPVRPGQAVGHLVLLELTERALVAGPAIMIVDWPEDASRLDDFRRFGVPRLVVIGPRDDAVVPTDELEDWVRLPADDRDVRVRLGRLRESARRRPPWPVIDEAGRVIFGGRWVAVSEVEERLASPLVERFGDVVRYDDLLAAGWPAGGVAGGGFGRPDRAILRPAMCRLRRRVEALGLELLSIRDVGYVLQARAPAIARTS